MKKLPFLSGCLMSFEKIPLPPYAYVPGSTPRHDEDFLDHVKELASIITQNENAQENDAWLFGIRLFENDFFWECHEVLETVWMNALPNSREKNLVQGVIHLSNAALKIKMQRPDASQRLIELADQCFYEAYLGMDPASLLLLEKADLDKAGERIQNGDCMTKIMNYSS